MSIALVTTDPSLQKLVEGAFEKANLSVEVFDHLKNVQEDQLCLVDSACDLKKIDMFSNSFWVFEKTDHKISDDQKILFDEVFEMPVRMGSVVDAITSALLSKLRKQAMKILVFGDYEFDPQTGIFNNKATQKHVRLTEKEQDILIYLHKNKDTKVLRDKLLEAVWQYAEGVETHTLETHIYRLRRKIEQDPSKPTLLVTDDEGYYLNFS